MKSKTLLASLGALMLPLLLNGCATRELLGIVAASTTVSTTGTFTVAQTRNLVGIGGSEQIFLVATFSGGDGARDVTGESTFVSSDPSIVNVTKAGVIELITGACDWVATTMQPNNTPGPPAVNPAEQITVTATFKNFTTTIFVNVNSTSNCPGPTMQQ